MIKLVAFDWNGTLFADTNACLFAVNKVLKFLKTKSITLHTYQATFTVPITDAYEKIGFKRETILKKSPQIAQVFHSNYEPRAKKARTRKHTKEVLLWLKQNHIPCIIFSNHLTGPIEFQLDRLKIRQYVKTVLANDHPESVYRERHKQKTLANCLKNKGEKQQ